MESVILVCYCFKCVSFSGVDIYLCFVCCFCLIFITKQWQLTEMKVYFNNTNIYIYCENNVLVYLLIGIWKTPTSKPISLLITYPLKHLDLTINPSTNKCATQKCSSTTTAQHLQQILGLTFHATDWVGLISEAIPCITYAHTQKVTQAHIYTIVLIYIIALLGTTRSA